MGSAPPVRVWIGLLVITACGGKTDPTGLSESGIVPHWRATAKTIREVITIFISNFNGRDSGNDAIAALRTAVQRRQ
jgi:hypothetical protein